MAIFKKRDLGRAVNEFEARAKRLGELLKGKEPIANVYHQYCLNMDEYQRDFVEVSLDELAYALGDFEVSLKELRKLKSKQAKTLPADRR